MSSMVSSLSLAPDRTFLVLLGGCKSSLSESLDISPRSVEGVRCLFLVRPGVDLDVFSGCADSLESRELPLDVLPCSGISGEAALVDPSSEEKSCTSLVEAINQLVLDLDRVLPFFLG